MSTTSKIVLAASAVLSVGTIGYVHFTQEVERSQLKQGIIVDTERRKRRQTQNVITLQKQIDLTKQLVETEIHRESMVQSEDE